MYICAQCGKKVIFSFQLKHGLCRSCLATKATLPPQQKVTELSTDTFEEYLPYMTDDEADSSDTHNKDMSTEEQPDELTKAKLFLTELVELHQATAINLRTASFEEVKCAAFACKNFIDKMELLPETPKIGNAIKDIAEKNILWWEIPGLGRIDYDEEKDLIMLGRLFEESQQLETKLISIVEHSGEFEKLFQSLHFFALDTQPAALQNPIEQQTWPSLRTYNVTARTPLASLERFIVLDVETTGLNPMENEIIQIAAIRFMNFYPVEVFSTYIKPRKGLNTKAAETNHITEVQVSDAPYFEDIQDNFTSFIADSEPLVGHKLSFDYNFLVASGLSFTTFFDRKAYDTLDLAKRVFSERYSYSLDAICRSELQVVRDNAHNAISDALATGLLFKKICQKRIGF